MEEYSYFKMEKEMERTRKSETTTTIHQQRNKPKVALTQARKQVNNETMPDQSTATTERRAPSNPDCNGSYSFHQVPRAYPREESEPEPKASQKIETIGGTRRSRKPTMPSFSILRRRLPPPLQSTGTVYTHLTVNSYRDDRSEHGQSSEGNKSEATLRTRSLTDTPQTKPEPLTALK
ncbi:hypothetical protein YC2023_025373 [Brassica napus]